MSHHGPVAVGVSALGRAVHVHKLCEQHGLDLEEPLISPPYVARMADIFGFDVKVGSSDVRLV